MKFGTPVHSILNKVPVVGEAVPALGIGALIAILAEQKFVPSQYKKYIKSLGYGLVGASAVHMGSNAAQLVPALSSPAAAVSGYDYAQLGGVEVHPDGSGDFSGIESHDEEDGDYGDVALSGQNASMC